MDENMMENDFEAKDRTTRGDLLMNSLRNLKFRDQNKVDQFTTVVDAVFNKILELETGILREEYREAIMNNISKLKQPYYKNAPSYVLGYCAIKDGNVISDIKIRAIFEELPSIVGRLSAEYSVFKIKEQDIVRYARLWQTLLRTP